MLSTIFLQVSFAKSDGSSTNDTQTLIPGINITNDTTVVTMRTGLAPKTNYTIIVQIVTVNEDGRGLGMPATIFRTMTSSERHFE